MTAIDARPVLAVVGMTREARILGGAGAVIIGGGDSAALAVKLEAALRQGAAGVVSFGLCGALDPALKVGDLVVGAAVGDGDALFVADPDWAARIAAALPGAALGRVAAADQPVAAAADKAALRTRTRAVAVDMESGVVARQAGRFGAPFAVVRAVSDAADRVLPDAAKVGLGPDGRPAIGPVLASLRADPWQLGALIRTALEAEAGFRALKRARAALGPRLGM